MSSSDKKLPSYKLEQFEYDQNGGYFYSAFKKYPIITAGFVGFFAIIAYRLKNISRRKVALDMHLIETRVMAQGLVISCMLLTGLQFAYNDYKKKKSQDYKSDVRPT